MQHIVSNVEGKLKPGMSNLDVLRATFPAGTLSGAPKVRAMEIIDELEPTKRGIYGGACGYLSFGGEMDLAIAIRTGVIKDGMLYVQAAAGIVADSVPEMEWQETENKARAVLRAAEQVQDGLDRRRSDHAADDRQLRLVHLQPRAVLRRAGRRRADVSATTKSRWTRSRRSSRSASAFRRDRARRTKRACRSTCCSEFAGKHADSRRLPRPPGDRRRRSAARSCARRQIMHGKTSTDAHTDVQGRVHGPAEPVQGRRATTRWRSSANRCRTAWK